MAQLGFFHYLRVKFWVTLFRILLRWRTAKHIRRDSVVLPLSDAGVRKQRIQIPSRDPGRYIHADLYLPPSHHDNDSDDNDSPKNKKKKKLPVLVNWHGSGFVFPLHGTDVYFCTRMARDAGIAVLDADYRKAPESPYPAAINDAEDALRWVAASATSAAYHLDPRRVAVSGFSAGGHIATVAATHLQEKKKNKQLLEKGTEKTPKRLEDIQIAALLSVYGSVDLAADAATKRAPTPSLRAIPAWALDLFADAYAPDPRTRSNPAVSPAFADLDAFPATTAFVTCEGDNLRAEMEALAERLRAGSKDRKVVHYKMLGGVRHAFDKGVEDEGSLPWVRREEAYAWAASLLKDALRPQQ